ncbi:chromosomal replication initiator protein DnaA [Patescibacteria group bacterium]|nr:chromosomal replication initiator protein DnaA [Patescibacteria group bacterium]
MNQLNVQELWRNACDILQQRMSQSSYTTWILTNPLTEFRLIGDDRAIGVITSPTAFHSANIEKNFYAQIKEVLDQLSGRNAELQFRVGSPVVDEVKTQPTVVQSSLDDDTTPLQSATPQQAPHARPLRTPRKPMSIQSLQERLQNLAQTKQHSDAVPSNSPQPTSGLFSDQTIKSLAVDRAKILAQKAGLRLEYTFETFAVSSTNEMAHAAAMAVSNQPGTAYNPLFIYGGVGVGKTHLMHAVGNNILKRLPDAKILYCTGEDFTNEIVHAIQTKKSMVFKEKYRTVDVLLIDDVQFIAGKNTVQEEFFHTFNSIAKRSGQIILTSDRPPAEISLLEDRLRSRFEAGLMVDIQQPSFELRTAILLIKAQANNLQIPMELAQVIASRIDSARKLEGIIKRIKSEVELKHRQITPQLIDELCKTELEKAPSRLRVKPYDVIKTVADFYHLKQSAIRGKVRVQSIVKARHIAMYFMKEELHLPYMEVGRWFSNRDHTSAMHALRKITAEMNLNDEVRQEVQAIRVLLEKISK